MSEKPNDGTVVMHYGETDDFDVLSAEDYLPTLPNTVSAPYKFHPLDVMDFLSKKICCYNFSGHCFFSQQLEYWTMKFFNPLNCSCYFFSILLRSSALPFICVALPLFLGYYYFYPLVLLHWISLLLFSGFPPFIFLS